MTLQIITYSPLEQPEVEVLYEGRWYFGSLTQWVQADDESWEASVTYTRPGPEFRERYMEHFTADAVRPNTQDFSPGGAQYRCGDGVPEGSVGGLGERSV